MNLSSKESGLLIEEPHNSSATEESAIDNYDYEQAMILYQAKQNLHKTDIEAQTEHYSKQLDCFNEQIQNNLAIEKEKNQLIYEEACKKAEEDVDLQIMTLSSQQLDEMKALEAKWRDAREFERVQIMKKVENLLHSSKLLAKSHHFQEAIEMRDQAIKIRDSRHHPEIDQCDADYRKQFSILQEKHARALDDVVEQYYSLLRLLKQQLETNNTTAEAASIVDGATGPIQIMNTVINSSKNRDATIAVVQAVSPRKTGRKLQKRSYKNSK